MSGTVVHVGHEGEEKMVGLGLSLPDGKPIFYHEERKGSQRLYGKYSSPGGVDDVVLAWCEKVGIEYVHHYTKSSNKLLIASVADIKEHGKVMTADGRTRLCLSFEHWEEAERYYTVPWIKGHTYL